MTRNLWAPWRMEYIEAAGATAGCIFCEFAAHEADDQRLILHRAAQAFLILNAYPYSSGHIMVVPYRHTDSLDAFSAREMVEVMRLKRLGVRILDRAYHPDGYNIGINMGRSAGAGITDHLHWHIVPRWNGDTNFMPMIAGVRVLPQSLEDTYRRLKAELPRAVLEGRRRPRAGAGKAASRRSGTS